MELGVPAVYSVITSDSFDTVMGFVQRFVEIGDAVAEVTDSKLSVAARHLTLDSFLIKVHPYAKVAWSVLTFAQKVCELATHSMITIDY